MSLRGVLFTVVVTGLLILAGCSTGGPDFVAKHEPWRETEESACLAAGAVRQSAFVQTRSSLGGPSYCGAARPFEMSAADQGRVSLRPPALLRCPMVPQVERWVSHVVKPTAEYYFGVPVVEMKVAASYGCRPCCDHAGGLNAINSRLARGGPAVPLPLSSSP